MSDKRNIMEAANWIQEKALNRGLLKRTPLFWRDYENTYPALQELGASYPAIRSACEELLRMREQILDIEDLGEQYTQGGIHTIQWKSYLLKMGSFVEENCRRCPRTAEALAKVPGAHVAFFSILSPHQYITPHFGYYKGFLRYHLGVIVPDNNANNACWLRINGNLEDNARRDKSSIDRGEKYFWHEGEGAIFDDTLLHDANNESDKTRVILWVDICRPMPTYLDRLHQALLWAMFKHSYFKQVRENATIPFSSDSSGGS